MALYDGVCCARCKKTVPDAVDDGVEAEAGQLMRLVGGTMLVVRRDCLIVYCPECAADVRVCGRCGCTDDVACLGGCFWVQPGLCSKCIGASVWQSPSRSALSGSHAFISSDDDVRDVVRRQVQGSRLVAYSWLAFVGVGTFWLIWELIGR